MELNNNLTVEQEPNADVRTEFLTAPLGTLIRKHTGPAVASMLFMAFYQIVDGIMVGRSLGPDAMASVNILYPVLALLVGLATMVAVGGNARIAVLLGAGESRQASKVLGLIVALGAALGLTGSIVCIVMMPQLLQLLGTSGDMGFHAGQYLRGLLPFFAFMILQVTLVQSMRNDGQANSASLIMAGCALLNIALDYLFLFVLGTGIAGAAMATGIAQSLGAVILLGYFVKKTLIKSAGLRLAMPAFSVSVLRAVVVNGSSEFFNNIAAGVITFLFNRAILTHVGILGVAAFSLVQYLLMLGIFIIMGIGSGTQPIFSYNHGAGLHERVRGTLWRVGAASTLVGVAVFLLMGLRTAELAVLFLPGNWDAVEMTIEVANYVRWSMLFMPLAMLSSMYFTALEQAGRSLIIAVCRGLIVPAVGLLVLPTIWGAPGIWITPLLAEAITVGVAVICLTRIPQKAALTSPNAVQVAEQL